MIIARLAHYSQSRIDYTIDHVMTSLVGHVSELWLNGVS